MRWSRAAVDSCAMSRHWRIISALTLAIMVALAGVGLLWLSALADPMPETEAAARSDELGHASTTEPWLTFTPTEPSSDRLHLLSRWSRAGAGLRTAGTRHRRGRLSQRGRRRCPSVWRCWHPTPPTTSSRPTRRSSAGSSGVIRSAVRWRRDYAAGHEAIDGLALWAAYPPDGTDLSEQTIAVTSVYATEDGLATIDEIEASRAQLPPDDDVRRDQRRQPRRVRLVRRRRTATATRPSAARSSRRRWWRRRSTSRRPSRRV